EGVDAGARTLGLLHLRDPLLAGAADTAKIVELGINAVVDDAPIASVDRGLVEQGAIELVAQISEIVEFGRQAADKRGLERIEQHAYARNGQQRLPQRHQVARSGGSERGPCHEPLDVVDPLQRFADLRALGAAEGKFLDRVKPILYALEREQ